MPAHPDGWAGIAVSSAHAVDLVSAFDPCAGLNAETKCGTRSDEGEEPARPGDLGAGAQSVAQAAVCGDHQRYPALGEDLLRDLHDRGVAVRRGADHLEVAVRARPSITAMIRSICTDGSARLVGAGTSAPASPARDAISRVAAPARSRHQPSGRDPITLATSTTSVTISRSAPRPRSQFDHETPRRAHFVRLDIQDIS
jgi:hypothetical protein